MSASHAVRRPKHLPSLAAVRLPLMAACLGLALLAAGCTDMDACQNNPGYARIAACTRVIESGRVKGGRLALAYYIRAYSRARIGDREGAFEDYDRSITADPGRPYAYKSRAYLYLLEDKPAQAAKDLAYSQELKPDAYATLWLYLARVRTGDDGRKELAANAAKLDQAKWPAPVLAFYQGQGTPESLLAAAESPDPQTRSEQVCEAKFYLAELHLLKHDTARAVPLLRAAAAQCPGNFVERDQAAGELERLGVRKTGLGG